MPTGIYKRTEQHCKNISKAKMGKKLSAAHKKKISETKKLQFRKLRKGGN